MLLNQFLFLGAFLFSAGVYGVLAFLVQVRYSARRIWQVGIGASHGSLPFSMPRSRNRERKDG